MEDRNLQAPLCILANLHVPSNPPSDLPSPSCPVLPLSLSLALSLRDSSLVRRTILPPVNVLPSSLPSLPAISRRCTLCDINDHERNIRDLRFARLTVTSNYSSMCHLSEVGQYYERKHFLFNCVSVRM